jgi:bifunctional NMN adenylyltransferase/nudix hydrolase
MQNVAPAVFAAKPKLGVMIGRFSFIHRQHERTLQIMAAENDYILVQIGSANRCESKKNPHEYAIRAMIMSEVLKRIKPNGQWRIVALNDTLYNEERWKMRVYAHGEQYAEQIGVHPERITLYGTDKDESTYYMNSFPQWKTKDVGKVEDIDATRLRELWFRHSQTVPGGLRLQDHLVPEMFNYLRDGHKFNAALQRDWYYLTVTEPEKFKDYPYPEALNVMCGDAIVECANHILTVTRSGELGYGQIALPGGHKNKNETAFQAALRELFEETNLRVPEQTILNCVKQTHLFDHPGRTLSSVPKSTLGVYIKIEARDGKFPRANGGDDAAHPTLPNGGIRWIPKYDIISGKVKMWDDHPDIVDFFTA